ncbi:homoserine dehydrogenase [Varunaivibrio sulfuroxidans]|uniref:Homoserine dehydrogenase n=1 Tax=Varunaivibrio sulfuroxidans TaxID=1773489 RepID=A0A4R3JEL6_9PROT|nr:homoserine dehydrogenase [Varunaivibrio sulfuroxidans]TCS64342.1 homoserine dehydrogenase [Varunaivibrio sulfuroxidans]WES31221.1 homoserine dehydrogenase [Varunaivibrio sulfuroxidans]
MNTPLKIAIAGLGTVGAGTVGVIEKNSALLKARCGREIVITAVSARDRGRDRGVDVSPYAWYDDPCAMAQDADCDVVVELIGGSEGVARDLVTAALGSGKHVVSANKALLAHHGVELAKIAEEKGVSLNYEAAVAGGIPIVKTLREGLAGNALSRVYGILNGTCNYILSTMRETGRDYADVLAEAQSLGYAEADPAFDIEGVDAAHKIAILASVAFGGALNFPSVHVEGITNISALDIQFADELGFRIKLLGIAERHDDVIDQRVHPCLVRGGSPISTVEGVFNAVVADGDAVDTLMHEGRGAGAGPTSSAVVADIADIARGVSVPTFGVPAGVLRDYASQSIADRHGAYYLRLMLVDRPGVFADIACALRDHDVSMESLLQRGRNPGEPVPVVVITHETTERQMAQAIAKIADIDGVLEAPHMIRIESF